jgi:hypothetical protein
MAPHWATLLVLQILLYPLHRLNHILAMAEGRQPEVPFPARTETGTWCADHVANVQVFVEERKDHVSARRNSINKHLKSQPTIPLTPPYNRLSKRPKQKTYVTQRRDDATKGF